MLRPIADGDLEQWSPIPGQPSYQQVLDLGGDDGDTTRILSTGVSPLTALFRFEDFLVAPAAVQKVLWVGVQASIRARLGGPAPDPGLVAAAIKSGGVLATYAPLSVDFNTYASRGGLADGWYTSTDPATGQPWTVAAAAACQAGLQDQQDPAKIYSVSCTSIRKLADVVLRMRNAVRGPYGDERH